MEEQGGFSDEYLKRALELKKLRETARKDLGGYATILNGILDTKQQINFFEEELLKFQKKKEEFDERQAELQEEERQARADKRDDLLEEIRLKQLQLKVDAEQNENNERIAREQLKNARELGEELAKQANLRNGGVAALRSTRNLMVGLGSLIVQQTDHLLEQQKAVKMSELQMGILSNRSKDYQENLFNAALHTNLIGVNSKSLAKMQGDYAQEVGRTVLLTEDGHQAMAELAEGTMLGEENAGRFAGQMEMFGKSVVASRDFMEETLNLATKMGLSGQTVTKKTLEALEVAERFNFRNGVKGAAKMAALLTKSRMEVSSIEKIAEKAFNPEGAVELAAQLSVLGGSWAQLGDPFSLMFKSRNDIEGLTEDIAKAAAAGAQWDEATQEFKIASAEMHRLREVSNATGISMEELTRSARNAAKFSKIKAEIRGNFDNDVMEFISATAQMGESGKFEVSIDGDKVFVEDLHKFTNNQLKAIAEEKATLEKRAKTAKTFDETWENLKNQFKATLLPGFVEVADSLTKGLMDFSEWMKKEQVLERIQKTFKWVGGIISDMIKWVADNPIKTGLIAAFGGLTYIIGSHADWIFKGRLLGMGFNSVAGAGGLLGGGKGGPKGGPGGSGGGGGLFGRGGKGGPQYRTRGGVKEIQTKSGKWINANSPAGKASANWRAGNTGRAAANNTGRGGGMFGKGLKSGGAMAGGLLSAGFSGYDEWSENSKNGMSSGENTGRTAVRAGLSGGGAWGGAALGASIGTMVFPGVGTAIGGLLGGIVGGLAGDTLGDKGGDWIFGDKSKKKANDPNSSLAEPPRFAPQQSGLKYMDVNSNNITSRQAQTNYTNQSNRSLVSGDSSFSTSSNKSEVSSIVDNSTRAYTEVADSNVDAYTRIANDNLDAYKEVSKNNLDAFSSLVAQNSNLIKGNVKATDPANQIAYATPALRQEAQDFVSRPGQQPIPFSSADTLIGMKKGGGIDNFLSKKENSTSSGKMDVKFTNAMKIEGKLNLEGSGGQSIKLNLDDPILIRQLSRLVQEELTISLNGKRNPNPVT